MQTIKVEISISVCVCIDNFCGSVCVYLSCLYTNVAQGDETDFFFFSPRTGVATNTFSVSLILFRCVYMYYMVHTCRICMYIHVYIKINGVICKYIRHERCNMYVHVYI